MSLITVPFASVELDWRSWGLPMTNAVNDHEVRIATLESGSIGRCVGRYYRTTTPSYATATEAGVLWLAAPVSEGHLYSIAAPSFGIYAAGSGYLLTGRIRYTLDGSVPIATSSPIATGSLWTHYVANSSGYVPTQSSYGLVYASATGTMRAMLTQIRSVGAGNCTIWPAASGGSVNLIVTDLGVDPGSSGTSV